MAVAIAMDHQQRREDEPDEKFMGEIDDGDILDCAQPIGAAEQRNAEHAVFEAGEKERERRMARRHKASNRQTEQVKADADGGDQDEQSPIGRLELHIEKHHEQHARQDDCHNQLLEVVDRRGRNDAKHP